MRCWAVGSTVGVGGAPNGAAIITTADGGVRWSTQVIPPTVGYLSAIACSDPRHCTAVGQAGQTSDGQSVVIVTTDGGAAWTQAQTPPGILDVTAVSCQPDRRCLAIGSTAAGGVALVSTFGGIDLDDAGRPAVEHHRRQRHLLFERPDLLGHRSDRAQP